jgi:large subunit ribosomal protein L18
MRQNRRRTPQAARQRRHFRLRKRISGTPERPRLAVYRSITHIYAQVIDDTVGVTLASASDLEADLKKASGTKSEVAKQVGTLVAQRAKSKGVDQVVFDRGGFHYHGRVKALADAAREAGLSF